MVLSSSLQTVSFDMCQAWNERRRCCRNKSHFEVITTASVQNMQVADTYITP